MPKMSSKTVVISARHNYPELALVDQWLQSEGIKATSYGMLVRLAVENLAEIVKNNAKLESLTMGQAMEMISRFQVQRSNMPKLARTRSMAMAGAVDSEMAVAARQFSDVAANLSPDIFSGMTEEEIATEKHNLNRMIDANREQKLQDTFSAGIDTTRDRTTVHVASAKPEGEQQDG